MVICSAPSISAPMPHGYPLRCCWMIICRACAAWPIPCRKRCVLRQASVGFTRGQAGCTAGLGGRCRIGDDLGHALCAVAWAMQRAMFKRPPELLDDLHPDFQQACGGITDAGKGRARKIDSPATDKWPAVVDAHHHAFTISHIGHPDL